MTSPFDPPSGSNPPPSPARPPMGSPPPPGYQAYSPTPIGFGKALGRELFATVFSGQIFCLGYLWMLWDDKQQTWHDKVVGSIVVRT